MMKSVGSDAVEAKAWEAFGAPDRETLRKVLECLYAHHGSGLFIQPLSIQHELISPEMGVRFLQDPMWKTAYPFLRLGPRNAAPVRLKIVQVHEDTYRRMARLHVESEDGASFVFQDIDYCFAFMPYQIGAWENFYLGALAVGEGVGLPVSWQDKVAAYRARRDDFFALERIKVDGSASFFVQGRRVEPENPFDKYEKSAAEVEKHWQMIKSCYQDCGQDDEWMWE